MNTIVQDTFAVPSPSQYQPSPARLTGILYLVIAVLGMFSPNVLQALVVPGDAATTAHNVSQSLWLFGGSLVAWVVLLAADIAVAATLYLLLEPASRTLSLVAAAFRLAYAAIAGAALPYLFDAFLLLTSSQRGAGLDAPQRQAMALSSLNSFNSGFLVALVFFGVHVVALGFLLYRSRYVPRALGVMLVAGGAGYIAHSLAALLLADQGGLAGTVSLVSAMLLAPAVIGEIGLTAWLLTKGVDERREADTARLFLARPISTDPRTAGATGGVR